MGWFFPKLYTVIWSPVEYPAFIIGGRDITVDTVVLEAGILLASEYAAIFLSQGKTKDVPSFKTFRQYIAGFKPAVPEL
jgi:hypothetical protein